MTRGWIYGLAALFVLGCAPKQGRFPTLQTLDEIVASPVPDNYPAPQFADVASWDLQGPLSPALGVTARAPQTDAERAVAKYAAGNPRVRLTEGMHCIAREIGAFRVEHTASPDEELKHFIVARCGEPVSSVVSSGRSAAGKPDDVDVAEIARRAAEAVLGSAPPTGDLHVGVWHHVSDGMHTVVVATGAPALQLRAPVPAQVEGKEIRITGRLVEPAAELRAMVNWGAFGAVPCQVASVQLPDFDILCPVPPEDEYAWFELVAVPPGRVLGRIVLSGIVSRKEAPGRYTRPGLPAEVTPPSEDEHAQALLDVINQVREAGGLNTLTLDPLQTKRTQQVTPHYFAAAAGHQPVDVVDTIAMGLMAGWEVDGDVLYGKLASTWSRAGSKDVRKVAASALERPFNRSVLLDPRVRRLAVGVVANEENDSMGCVFATYALVEHLEQAQRVQKVLTRLVHARVKAGLSPPVLLRDLQAPAAAAAGALEAGAAADKTLQALMEDSAQVLRAPVAGLRIEVSSLSDLVMSPDLAKLPVLELGIAVAQAQDPREPWTHYVVLIVVKAPVPA